jgi:hypothetical protein
MRTSTLVVLLGSAIALGCSTQQAPEAAATPAAEQPSYAPVLSLNQMMVTVVDSHSHEIWDAAEKPPTSDQAWAELEHAAGTLASAGSLTRMGGNGPDDQRWPMEPDWNKYSQKLSDAGLSVFRAVNAKDPAALSKAGDALVLSCIECHKEYKLNVPRIWSDHEGVAGTE